MVADRTDIPVLKKEMAKLVRKWMLSASGYIHSSKIMSQPFFSIFWLKKADFGRVFKPKQ